MYSPSVPESANPEDSHRPIRTDATAQRLRLASQFVLQKADDPVREGKINAVSPESTGSYQLGETQSSSAAATMRSTRDRYQALLHVSNAVADQSTVNDVLRSLRSVLSNVSCVYSAGLYLFTDDHKGLKLFAYDRDADGIAVPIGTEVPCTEAFARAVERQQPVYVPDVAQEMPKLQELAPFASRIGVHRAYLFPVATARKQYGVVAFTIEQGSELSSEDVELMGSLASHIAVAVENWVYRQQLAEEQDRLRASHEDLQRSEAYLAEAQRLSRTGSWAFNVSSRKYSYLSEECFRIFELDSRMGLPTREAISRLIHRKDWDKVQEDFEKLLREKVDTLSEFRVVLPSGATKDLQAIRHPVLNVRGEVVQVVGTVADITERRRAEDALRISKAELAQERDRLSLLLEVNNHAVSKLEASELFEAVAASARKHLGNDAIAFWIFNKQSGCLERKYLDFPTGKGFVGKSVITVPANLESEWWRVRKPRVFSSQEMADLRSALPGAFHDESLLSHVFVTLVGAKGPLGLLNISARRANAFSRADLDLLSQIGTQISLALDNALAYGRLRASHDDLEAQRLYLESEINSEYNFEDIVGRSSAIKRVLQQVAVIAPTDSTVLLHGETGTGKELIARAIHNLSSRRARSLVRMNCAAIPSGLLESELFGHEKGAFTGALMQRRGRFELADHGTLFLDEIGDISLDLQPKLLRAVQEQEFERLGSAKTLHVNVRIIAATHRDLAAMIREGKFREDLFYRLNVVPIEIPPLRNRREDIPLLVNYFTAKLSRRIGKKIKSISQKTMDILTNNAWPGNVRELANFLERAVILTEGEELQVPLPEFPTSSARQVTTVMAVTVQETERAMIIEALRAASGRVSGKGGAAERLGLKRTTLQHKMQRLGITPTQIATDRKVSGLGFHKP